MKILASKSGKKNMGGYYKNVTAHVYIYENIDLFYFRNNYGDTPESFKTKEAAMQRLDDASKWID